jgi:hypothetical protein
MTAFKRSQARYVNKSYKTTNWPEYEAGLRKRGSLTVWISEDEPKGWGPAKRGQRKPGGQEQYSNRAIETALTVAMVFHLGLRQAEGFLRSLFSLLNLNCRAPDHTTISRRARKLGRTTICRPAAKRPVHILIDATGLKVHVGTPRGRAGLRRPVEPRTNTERWRRPSAAPSEQEGSTNGAESEPDCGMVSAASGTKAHDKDAGPGHHTMRGQSRHDEFHYGHRPPTPRRRSIWPRACTSAGRRSRSASRSCSD